MKTTIAVTIGVAAILMAPAAQAYPPRIAPGDDAALCASLDDGGTVSPVSYVATFFKVKTGSNGPEVYLPEMLDAVASTCPALTDSLLQANAHLESASFEEQRILDDQARARNGCYSLPCNPTPIPAGS